MIGKKLTTLGIYSGRKEMRSKHTEATLLVRENGGWRGEFSLYTLLILKKIFLNHYIINF